MMSNGARVFKMLRHRSSNTIRWKAASNVPNTDCLPPGARWAKSDERQREQWTMRTRRSAK